MTGQVEETLHKSIALTRPRAVVAWTPSSRLAGAVVVLTVAYAALSMAVAVGGRPNPGLMLDPVGHTVRSVTPGSASWSNGIRPGQSVVSAGPDASIVGSPVVTQTGGVTVYSMIDQRAADLRGSVSAAILGLLAAVISLLSIGRSASMTIGLAGASFAGTTVPFLLMADPATGLVAGVLSLAGPFLGLSARFTSPRSRAALAMVAAVSIIGWVLARQYAPEFFDTADSARAFLAAGSALMIVISVIAAASWSRWLRSGAPTVLDTFVAAGAACAAVLTWVLGDASPWLVLAVVLVAVVAYGRWRDVALDLLDRVVFAGPHDRATLEAAEAERARIARDLHDVPLQQIAGVIKRLEAKGDADDEVDALRRVAAQLRVTAFELAPPVLHDLGLPAALSWLVEQAVAKTGPSITVTNQVRPAIDDPAATARPPADVEAAVFRIVEEALSNAIQHSGATVVEVEGSVTPQRVAISIADDGTGLDRRAIRSAQQAGHFGLSTMRQRTEAVGAAIRISQRRPGHGTVVAIDWRSGR